MELMLITVILLQVATLVAAVAAIVWRTRRAINPSQIAGALANRVLERSAGELHRIDERVTRLALTEQYVGMVAAFGLPAAATDDITRRAWAIIAAARGGAHDPAPGPVIYD